MARSLSTTTPLPRDAWEMDDEIQALIVDALLAEQQLRRLREEQMHPVQIPLPAEDLLYPPRG
ncbi:hypothetical protein JCM17960_21710 [Magnetospira thiophila]